MNTKLFLCIVLLFLCQESKCQSELDSLLANWHNEELHDTIRYASFDGYIWSGFLFSNPDTASILALELFEYAKSRDNHKYISSAKNTEGISYAVRGMYDEALARYNFSLNFADSVGDRRSYELTLNNLGILHKTQGNYVKALKCYLEVIEIKKELGLPEIEMRALYANIGNIYTSLEDWENSMKYYLMALPLAEEAGDLRGQATAQHNIGSGYSKLGKDSLALVYLNRSFGLYEQAGDPGGVGYTMNTLGEFYLTRGQTDSAEVHFSRAVDIHSKFNNRYALTFPLIHLGTIYLEKEQFELAEEYCQRGYDLALEVGIIESQHEACECLYQLNKKTGQGDIALEFHEEMMSLADSLKIQETAKQLQLMEFRKEMAADSLKQEEERRLLQEAHEEDVEGTEQSRNFFVIAGLIALIAAIVIFIRYQITRKAKAKVEAEKDQSENLLLNILPAEIAQELKETGEAKARNFNSVTVLFTDFKGFTKASEQLGPEALVAEINVCFKRFDEIVGEHGIEKIKTIGDAYMAAGGLPVPDDNAATNIIKAALEMQAFMKKRKYKLEAMGMPGFEMRVGVHSGPVVAGIVGVKKFQYDVWGDTVNTASRMESSGMVNQVNISESTYEKVKDHPDFVFESRGKIEAKGKGEMSMYFVSQKD